jgi:hypothetical protein
MIESSFGNWIKREVFVDKDKRAEILNFGVDNGRKWLIVLSGIKNQKNHRDKFFTIYCIETEKIITHI